MKRIQLIYANYGCAAEIRQSIQSLVRTVGSARVDIVVVNNGGDPFEGSDFNFPDTCRIQVVSPGRNLGYFGALKEAVAAAPHEGEYAFRVLCNPDIEFVDPALFGRLAEMELEDSVAILAPSVISGISGTDQNPYLASRPSEGLLRRWRWMYSSWGSYALYQLLSNTRLRLLGSASGDRGGRHKERAQIYAPHGAFIIFANQFIEQAHDLDRIPFLFAEELFLGEICHRSNRTVVYRPDLQVRHIEHATTTKIGTFNKFRMHKSALWAFLAFRRSA
jgi:GT2 family glycosyltransferase